MITESMAQKPQTLTAASNNTVADVHSVKHDEHYLSRVIFLLPVSWKWLVSCHHVHAGCFFWKQPEVMPSVQHELYQ